MEQKPVQKPDKNEEVTVTGHNADLRASFVDVLTEARVFSGMVYLSLAQTFQDAETQLQARVETRLRMSPQMAKVIYDHLGAILARLKQTGAQPPTETKN